MKVCLDIQPAVSQRAGVGRYVAELVSHLPKQEEITLDLFYFDFKGRAVPPKADNCRLRPYSLFPGMLVQQAWKRLGWPRFDALSGPADLFHFTNFIIPPISKRAKTIVSIHDISFLIHPEYTEKGNLDYLSSRIKATTERADAVITISHQSAKDLKERLGVSEDRLFPIHLGVSSTFSPASETAVKATMQALRLDRPYILMVGTFEPRKNISFAVKLFEKMQSFDGDLIIVGQKGWKNEPIFDAIRQSGAAARIKTFTALDDNQLIDLYSGAEFFLMTSFYEGFGMPPVEAMACGRPVLTSSGGSLAEVVGDAAIVVDGYDTELWLEKADLILHDSALRKELVAKGTALARTYRWQKTAEEHLAAYRKVAQ